MLHITYLGHSGFLAETEHALLLFDYYIGRLPVMPQDKQLFIFASHAHHDHFNRKILRLDQVSPGCVWILSDDIRQGLRRGELKELEEKNERLSWVSPYESIEVPGLGRVETYESTDEGVAFLVDTGDHLLWHAGDLHWWNWPGEDPGWLQEVETGYKAEIKRLSGRLREMAVQKPSGGQMENPAEQGRRIDAAFLVLDDRLEENYWQGMMYFLEHCPVKNAFPMHYWQDASVIESFLKLAGQYDLAGSVRDTSKRKEWDL